MMAMEPDVKTESDLEAEKGIGKDPGEEEVEVEREIEVGEIAVETVKGGGGAEVEAERMILLVHLVFPACHMAAA